MKTSDSQHTPGPWEVERPFQEKGIYVQSQDTSIVCKVYSHRTGSTADTSQGKANARLIASAPDILGCLKEALPRIKYLHANIGCDTIVKTDLDKLLNKIESAINHAEGK